ncbi:MAG: hypothetical protein ABW204_05440 [Microbacteriaceae bacterium]
MIDALIGVGVVLALLAVIVAFIRWDQRHPESRPRGGVGPLGEIFQPTNHQAQAQWEEQQRSPAPPPLPGDPPPPEDPLHDRL